MIKNKHQYLEFKSPKGESYYLNSLFLQKAVFYLEKLWLISLENKEEYEACLFESREFKKLYKYFDSLDTNSCISERLPETAYEGPYVNLVTLLSLLSDSNNKDWKTEKFIQWINSIDESLLDS